MKGFILYFLSIIITIYLIIMFVSFTEPLTYMFTTSDETAIGSRVFAVMIVGFIYLSWCGVVGECHDDWWDEKADDIIELIKKLIPNWRVG